jgi:ribosome biogenesis GTPase
VQLSKLGWEPFFEQQVTEEERTRWTAARVVWEGRGAYRISDGGDERQADISGRLRHRAASRSELPTVGDWVLASSQVIHRVLARRTAFARGAAGRRSGAQIVAANVDTVLLVTSLNRDFNVRRLERYLALAWESGATPIVVLNKADLCPDPEALQLEASSHAIGVPVLITSGTRGDGLPALSEIVRNGGTSTLLGSSGVGKSTLINHLLEASPQAVREIRSGDDRGRHATTSRQLFVVPGGGVLIDTPGMRELQVWDAEHGLEHTFADIEALTAECRFRDCSHEAEPGCEVLAAIRDGRLDPGRLESFHRLKREERYLRERQEEGTHKERGRAARIGSRAIKQMQKLRQR